MQTRKSRNHSSEWRSRDVVVLSNRQTISSRMCEVSRMSHHERIYAIGGNLDIGYIRIRNDGVILSIWIDTEKQKMLFLPEHPELIGEEE